MLLVHFVLVVFTVVLGPHLRPPRLLITLYLRPLPRHRRPIPPRRRCRPRRRLGCRIGPNGASN